MDSITNMPAEEVMHKFKHGQLHSGSKTGPKVKKRSQAIAIMMSEKKKAAEGKKEYQSVDTAPSRKVTKKRGI